MAMHFLKLRQMTQVREGVGSNPRCGDQSLRSKVFYEKYAERANAVLFWLLFKQM